MTARSDERKRREDPLVKVATAPNEAVAGMWADVLKQESIESLTKRAALSVTFHVGFNTPCRLYVLASEAERAKQILASFVEDA